MYGCVPLVDVLVLDNSFSWTKGKNILYSVEIVPIEESNDDSTSPLQLTTEDLNIN